MKNAEPTIERLLAGLRDAAPEPGIEHRIREAMRARETVASVSLWSRLRPQKLPAFTIVLASALTIAGAFVAVALHQHWRAPEDSGRPRILAVRQESSATAITHLPPVPARRQASRFWSKRSRIVTPAPELPAASFPAPPLPLTQQEKLLLRVAHQSNQKDITILNPATQAAESAKANEQFRQFFQLNAKEMRNQIE